MKIEMPCVANIADPPIRPKVPSVRAVSPRPPIRPVLPPPPAKAGASSGSGLSAEQRASIPVVMSAVKAASKVSTRAHENDNLENDTSPPTPEGDTNNNNAANILTDKVDVSKHTRVYCVLLLHV